MPRLRVMAYNVCAFRAGPDALAKVVRAEEPDLAFLVEVKRGDLGRFAGLVGMRGVSGLSLFRPVTHAVLTRSPWRVGEERLVPMSRFGWRRHRTALVAMVDGPRARLTAVCVHLGLVNDRRARHARVLTRLMERVEQPVLLGGDLNEGPEAPGASWIADRYEDAFGSAGHGDGLTFSARRPRARIDYLFASRGIEIERAWVGSGDAVTDASDHRPLFAELVI